MSAIKSKDTNPEKLLGKSLWKLGLRYRKHYNVIGKPDFVLVAVRIAIFCDGDFWHGNNWKIRGLKNLNSELKSYKSFWKEKILKNIARDKAVNKKLKEDGWTVVRFFESTIKKSAESCAKKVLRIYLKKKTTI
jgi:DNA mismatch endonuclease, patch repair protein